MKRYMVGVRDGRCDVLLEDDATPTLEVAPNIFARDLWVTRDSPADLAELDDPVGTDAIVHDPPARGSILRIERFMPGETMTAQQMIDAHVRMKSVHIPTLEELGRAKDPTMHKTNSLNYLVLVSGKLWMLTEGRDVLLEAGDLVVMNGGVHGWRHEGEEPAILAAILLDAMPI